MVWLDLGIGNSERNWDGGHACIFVHEWALLVVHSGGSEWVFFILVE
jgi:hypothetical protein